MKKPSVDGPKEIFAAHMLYREWASRFHKLQIFDKAIETYTRSMGHDQSDDLKALLGLQASLRHSNQFHDAAKAAQRCIELDPNNYKVKLAAVNTLFKVAEYCYSLMHAHQGYRRRSNLFQAGIYENTETIENCVGRNTAPKALRRMYPMIRKMELAKEAEGAVKVDPDEFYDVSDERFKVNDPEARHEVWLRKLRRMCAQIYLGALSCDLQFMESLTTCIELWTANKKASEELYAIAKDAFVRAKYRQETLRMRKPLYYFRFLRDFITPGHWAEIRREWLIRRYNVAVEANFLLMRLHRARMAKDYRLYFQYLDLTKDKFDSYSAKLFPAKDRCLAIVYKMTGFVYIDPRDVTCIQPAEMKLLHIKHHVGVRESKLPRDIDLAWPGIMNKKKTLKTLKHRLSLASDQLELTWLFHDLCRFYVQTRRYELARYYAKKAKDASLEAENEHWELNVVHLLLRIEICQHNRTEAKEVSQVALESAKKLNIKSLVDFYTRVDVLMGELDFERMTSVDSVTIRENLIINLQPAETRPQVDKLFRTMNAMPPSRRLSVMPGCKPPRRDFKITCKRHTIVQVPPKDPVKVATKFVLRHHPPPTRGFGYINFDDFA